MHDLLRRQLKRLGLTPDQAPSPESWAALLERVGQAYADSDSERALSDRSQEIVSREMQELYRSLSLERDLLESRVVERTRALADSEARFRALTRLSSDWFWEQDEEHRFTMVSDGREDQMEGGHAYLGLRHWEIPGLHPLNVTWPAHVAKLERREPYSNLVYRIEVGDQDVFISVSGEPRYDADGRFLGYRGVARDVTAEKRSEQKVFQLAHYDTLTGLMNRTMLADQLEAALSRARRTGRQLAVLFIDLDGFKQVNDTFGHAVGDGVLQECARRLRAAVRVEDAIARLGGDEFLVVLDEPTAGSPEVVGRRILASLSAPIVLDGREFQLSASVGVSVFPADSADAELLMQQADLAMYRVKDTGGNNIGYFAPELQRHANERMELGIALRRAMEADELRLAWQPKLDLRTGRVTGAEALLRWTHPDLGAVSPDQFIPVAEETGLIVPIGRWVITMACAQGRAWMDAGAPIRVAVNLSARQFRDEGLVRDVAHSLAESGLDPSLLELELCESMVMHDSTRTAAILRDLKAMGVRIALDDFGTGYSSLAWLRRFPIDTLKIDRSFIHDLPNDPEAIEITKAVIAMARSLRLTVVAEGVERHAQAHLLRSLGCDEMQGFLVLPPVPAVAFDVFMQTARASDADLQTLQ